MTGKSLIGRMNRSQMLCPSALINMPNQGLGVVFRLGGNLSDKWQSGDIIVFWANGDQTTLTEENEFDLISWNVFKAAKP